MPSTNYGKEIVKKKKLSFSFTLTSSDRSISILKASLKQNLWTSFKDTILNYFHNDV